MTYPYRELTKSQAKFKSAVGRNLLQSWVNLTIQNTSSVKELSKIGLQGYAVVSIIQMEHVCPPCRLGVKNRSGGRVLFWISLLGYGRYSVCSLSRVWSRSGTEFVLKGDRVRVGARSFINSWSRSLNFYVLTAALAITIKIQIWRF